MPAAQNREIILELILSLIRLLRHVNICAEANAGRERKERHFVVGVDQIVPVGISNGGRIDDSTGECGVERDVSQQQSVLGEIAFAQVVSLARLIIQPQIFLVVETGEDVVLRIKGVIDARIDTPIIVRSRQNCRRVRTQAAHEIQLRQSIRSDWNRRCLILLFVGEEKESFMIVVIAAAAFAEARCVKRPAKGAAPLFAIKRRLRLDSGIAW